MTVYCPESRTLLKLTAATNALDANAVIDCYEDGVLTERAYAILDITYNADTPQPHETIPGLLLNANSETLYGAESFIRESALAFRITHLNTLEVWIIALGNFAPRVLLYQD
jgi:hypothetical protein